MFLELEDNFDTRQYALVSIIWWQIKKKQGYVYMQTNNISIDAWIELKKVLPVNTSVIVIALDLKEILN